MSIDTDWSPDFCLSCDRQTDGGVYCSEACRLAEYEKASSTTSSAASSPRESGPLSWPIRPSKNAFFLEPAYNFSNPKPYGATPRSPSFYLNQRLRSSPVTFPSLTPCTSSTSLYSIRSNTVSQPTEATQLSHESRKALRAYASSFDQSRYSRRQSTH